MSSLKAGASGPQGSTLFPDRFIWHHQNDSMIIPGGFQKTHNAPLNAHHPPGGGEHGRRARLRWRRAGIRAYQLIHVPVRSEAEAYHAHRCGGDTGCQVFFIFYQSTLCYFFLNSIFSLIFVEMDTVTANSTVIEGRFIHVFKGTIRYGMIHG